MATSTFDIFKNAPGLLRIESLNMAVKFERLPDNKGKISWNIPTPASGCTADNQAYCGIVFILDNKPINYSDTPVEKKLYVADPTASLNLFSGERIGEGRVIGAFYQDRTTTSFEITDVEDDVAYYIAGYPVDCQYRYFIEGVHSYSQNYSRKELDPTVGSQMVVLNDGSGVLGTDSTELDANTTYNLKICLGLKAGSNLVGVPLTNYDQCSVTDQQCFNIDIDGNNAQTYDELISEFNHQFNLASSCQQGAVPPNTNALYFDQSTNTLYQWSGYQYVQLPVYVNNVAPNTLVNNVTYWYDGTNLYLWSSGAWVLQQIISYSTDPRNPVCDKTIWFDGIIARKWNGVNWCDLDTFVQVTDPINPTVTCGSFWYDNTNVYKWDVSLDIWINSLPIFSKFDPETLIDGDYWFDTKINTINQLQGGFWVEVDGKIRSSDDPKFPEVDDLWYNPSTDILNKFDGTDWIEQRCITHDTDPTDRESCHVWYDSVSNIANIWDSITDSWDSANTIVSSIDPSLPLELSQYSAWINDGVLSLFINGCWIPAEYLYITNSDANGPVFSDGDIWHDTTNNTFFILDSNAWVELSVLFTTFDPNNIPVGTFWYQPSTTTLFMWNGIGWTNIPVSFTSIKPTLGTCWYNTTDMILQEWNGSEWIEKNPILKAELNCKGNIVFINPILGSLSFVQIPEQTDIAIENRLFDNIGVTYKIQSPNLGDDGRSGIPSYAELGVGTDGSNDERLQLINEIRYELGYPVIDVELTKEQMDLAVSRALEILRQQTGVAYKTGYFFLQVKPEQQRYLLTNKTKEYNKIVDIMSINRLTSAFLSSAHGAGVYGQVILQHLYNMGNFDLLSFHSISQYIENMEIMFASRITFEWNEQKRELWIHKRFPMREKMVLIEATVERTEQDILSDRWVKGWIRKYSTAVCMDMLANVRGKFSSLPGANGSITLNAMELRSRAKELFDECIAEIRDYTIDDIGNYGLGSQFVMG